MAKRLLDDALLTSPSLHSVTVRTQDAFPRIILLADDFGCFDANAWVMKGRGWALRPDVTPEEIASWLDELERAGMVQLWRDGDRWYGYLSGWCGPKGQRKRDEYDPVRAKHGSKRKTPTPPARSEKPSDYISSQFPPVPAVSRQFPAHAVPVPVPVPVKDSVASQLTAAASATARVGKRREVPSPRHGPTIALLSRVFRGVADADYDFDSGKDGSAVKRLLAFASATDAEIERRWRVALTLKAYPGTRSIAQFVQRWNEFASATGPPPPIQGRGALAPSPASAFAAGGKSEF